jgi:phosphate starvation-inducible PhoH-like protein
MHVRSEIEVEDPTVLIALAGPGNETLRAIAQECRVEIGLRGSVLLLSGDGESVALAERFLTEAAAVLRTGTRLTAADCVRGIRLLKRDPSSSFRALFEDVVLITPGRRSITPRSEGQKCYVTAIRGHDLTFGIGPAGTGKTYLAMAMAVQDLMERRIKRIILARPAVEAGEKLGFLPGDLAEKVNPYLRPLYDALHDMMDFDKAQAMIHRGQIEVAPLAFMRGRTLNDSFVILDEAQNTTSEQMRMFLTRLGNSSKSVITGDITQVDLPSGQRSGLAEARTLLRDIEGISFCELTDKDVVRHPLVQKIIVAYEARDAERRARRDAARSAVNGRKSGTENE